MSLMAIPHPRARFPLDEPLARFVVTIAREGGRDGEGEGRTSNFSPSNRGEVCIEPGSKMRNCLSITRGGEGYHRRRGKINAESDSLQFSRQLINICIRSIDASLLLAESRRCGQYFQPDSKQCIRPFPTTRKKEKRQVLSSQAMKYACKPTFFWPIDRTRSNNFEMKETIVYV